MNTANKLTDLVVASRRAFVPQDLSEEERSVRFDTLATLMDGYSMDDVSCCHKDPRLEVCPFTKKLHTQKQFLSTSLYSDSDIEIKCVYIPPGSKIPLHDHP